MGFIEAGRALAAPFRALRRRRADAREKARREVEARRERIAEEMIAKARADRARRLYRDPPPPPSLGSD
jgi:hypothetical protein